MDATKKSTPGDRPAKDSDLFGNNSEIARKLRSYYGSLVKEEVPDRFTELLSRLESADPAKKED